MKNEAGMEGRIKLDVNDINRRKSINLYNRIFECSPWFTYLDVDMNL